MIERFVVYDAVNIGLPVRNLDKERIIELSDTDFSKFYLELMCEYEFVFNGIVRKCSFCHIPITGPKELRRFYGQSLHPDCFRKEYERVDKSKMSKSDKMYFERVLNLIY